MDNKHSSIIIPLNIVNLRYGEVFLVYVLRPFSFHHTFVIKKPSFAEKLGFGFEGNGRF